MTNSGEIDVELTCQELVELVTEYLEDSLPATARAAFEEHLQECENCHHYLDQMRRTIQIVGKLTEASLAPDVQAELLAHFRHWKQVG
jgi:anti-sigma factor RsiW